MIQEVKDIKKIIKVPRLHFKSIENDDLQTLMDQLEKYTTREADFKKEEGAYAGVDKDKIRADKIQKKMHQHPIERKILGKEDQPVNMIHVPSPRQLPNEDSIYTQFSLDDTTNQYYDVTDNTNTYDYTKPTDASYKKMKVKIDKPMNLSSIMKDDSASNANSIVNSVINGHTTKKTSFNALNDQNVSFQSN